MIDYGICKIPLTELAWEPSNSNVSNIDNDISKTLNFTLVSETRNAMPELLFSTQN